MTTPSRRWYSTDPSDDDGSGGTGMEDNLLSQLQVDHQKVMRERAMPSREHFEQMIMSLIPSARANTVALAALRTYFQKTKINEYIPCEKVLITFVEQADGTEVKAEKRPPITLQEALDMAKGLGGKDVVMMGEANGIAFCKIRNERARAIASVESLLVKDVAPDPNAGVAKAQKLVVEYSIKEVIDRGQLEWRSKKIVDELKRKHPIRVSMQKFVTPAGAIGKFKELLVIIKTQAMADGVGHIVSNVGVAPEEISVSMHSPEGMKEIKHPTEEEWNKHLQRFSQAFAKGGREEGRTGTWKLRDASKVKKRQGSRLFRVDKFGNEITDGKVSNQPLRDSLPDMPAPDAKGNLKTNK